jgi:serine/alanine racemase
MARLAASNPHVELPGIDVGKMICAVLILILHTSPLAAVSGKLEFVSRGIVTTVAVPFFFLASSYLFFSRLGKDDKEDVRRFRRTVARLLRLYFLWSLIYFPLVLMRWHDHGGFTSWKLVLYLRDFIFSGSYGTIWFILALIYAIPIVFYINRVVSSRCCLLLTSILYLFGLLGSSYYGTIRNMSFIYELYQWYFSVFSTVKNGLLFGGIFVALGSHLAKRGFRRQPRRYFGLAVLSGTLLAVEAYASARLGIDTGGYDLRVFLVPCALFTFMWLSSVNLSSNRLYYQLRHMSILTFLTQRIFLTLCPSLMPRLGMPVLVSNSMLYFLLVSSLTLALSKVILAMSYTKTFRFLQYLY